MAQDVNQSEKDVAAQVRSALVRRISSERYDLWIPQSTTWRFDGEKIVLSFENDFHCQLAKRMLHTEIANVSSQELGSQVEVHFDVVAQVKLQSDAQSEASPRRQADPRNDESHPLPGSHLRVSPRQPCSPPQFVDSEVRRDLPISCPQFIAGESNQLAWATAKLVVADPGKMSPVLIHGPSGSGKTLLATAISQQLRVSRRMHRVVHMSSEQFTNDFTEGLRGGGLPMFRKKYRDVEALVLEDIQFLVGKKSTLNEVKHTLDNLIRTGKQVVLTSDRSINELAQLGGDLAGRIRGGLLAPIFPLDETTRLSLLERELAAEGIEIEKGVVQTIANRVTGDGRVVSGIVKRLAAVSALRNSDGEPETNLNWDDCWAAIFDLVQATQPIVRLVDIERVVCDVFGLQPDSLQSQTKTRTVSQPRMLAMFLARKYTPAAYKEIGDYFGRRRHSTVISAEKTVESWLADGERFKLGRGMSVEDAIRHVKSQLQVG